MASIYGRSTPASNNMFWSIARFATFTTATLLVIGAQKAAAQKFGTAKSDSHASYRISLGQPIEDVLQSLRRRKLELAEGTLATVLDECNSYYTLTLDENHAFACLFYSKASRKVSRISICFYPHRNMQQKTYRSWLQANSLRIHADRSYSVDFAKPQPTEELSGEQAAAKSAAESPLAENATKPSSKTTTNVLGLDVPIVGARELDKHVGGLIAVAGTPSRTKIARISDVEVQCPHELRGRPSVAVGILGRWVVTEQQAVEMNRKGLAHDGPGVKYILYADLQGKISEARPVNE
jgi:hypothetical protein